MLSHESSSGGNQVCECVSWVAVPRSHMGVLTWARWVSRLGSLRIGDRRKQPRLGQAHLRYTWMACELLHRSTPVATEERRPNRLMPRAEMCPSATGVKNEGAFPPADARTYRPEEGSDGCSLMPPQAGEVEGSLD